MSEKRFKQFTSSIDYYDFWDTVDEKGLTKEDVVDLLNEQQEEIDYLKDLISAMNSDIKNAMRMVSRWNDE